MAAEILYEDDRIRITRVHHKPGNARPRTAGGECLIIDLSERRAGRTESGKPHEAVRADRSEPQAVPPRGWGALLVVEFKGRSCGSAATPMATSPRRRPC